MGSNIWVYTTGLTSLKFSKLWLMFKAKIITLSGMVLSEVYADRRFKTIILQMKKGKGTWGKS